MLCSASELLTSLYQWSGQVIAYDTEAKTTTAPIISDYDPQKLVARASNGKSSSSASSDSCFCPCGILLVVVICVTAVTSLIILVLVYLLARQRSRLTKLRREMASIERTASPSAAGGIAGSADIIDEKREATVQTSVVSTPVSAHRSPTPALPAKQSVKFADHERTEEINGSDEGESSEEGGMAFFSPTQSAWSAD